MARKILLADDSVTAQNMGRKILADAGYEVTTVNNGSAALKKIGEQRPDLIVLDVYMPGYSGLEVCQRLKEVGDTSRIPILLTVGKLEPFKPEEAKRVRADGYIVKPFEASELLSALSKLEDKVVPRSETSKPGRLARATAAIDESRYDKTTASEEDSGWKKRIAFPSKRNQQVAEADVNDPAVYNPVNKDLRTVVEQTPPSEEKQLEERVDVGALAPEGLPTDVTPEEIAALAAAAAHVQAAVSENKAADQEKVSEPDEARTETLQEETPTQPPEAVSPATFAEQSPQERIETAERGSNQEPTASVTDTGSISSVKNASVDTQTQDVEGDSRTKSVGEEPKSELPVTMAAAAEAESVTSTSRWAAVSVALAPEDDGISLEEEMQKAYAAFAAAEASTAAEIVSPPAAHQEQEPVAETAGTLAEVEQVLSEVASLATESVAAVAREFETVASGHVAANNSVAEGSFIAATESVSVNASHDLENKVEQPAAGVAPSTEVAAEATAEAQSVVNEGLEPKLSEPQETSTEPMQVATVAGQAIADQDTGESTTAASLETAKPESHEKESDLTSTTAAAWASWRRIRESDSNATQPDQPSASASDDQEAAAMAAAAGAENSPEETGAGLESDPAIASIVESVLADLRPRIVEEISRKLGKKK